MTPVGPWSIPGPPRAQPDRETELAELAAYYVGLFAGHVSALVEGDRPTVAHALWIMGELVADRRTDWLA